MISNAPIDVASNHIELQDRANRALLTGNVVDQASGDDADRGAGDGDLYRPDQRRIAPGLAARRIGRRHGDPARSERAFAICRL